MVRSKTYMTRSMMGIIVGTMLAITAVAYCALSMEGRRHWIEESSPFQTKLSYTSKVLMNLVFTLPFVGINGALLWIATKPQACPMYLATCRGLLFRFC